MICPWVWLVHPGTSLPGPPHPSPVVTGSREGLRETSVSPPLTGVSSRMSLICGPATASPCADSRVCRSLPGHHLRARFCTSLSGDVPGPVQLVPMPQRQEAWGGGRGQQGNLALQRASRGPEALPSQPRSGAGRRWPLPHPDPQSPYSLAPRFQLPLSPPPLASGT